MNPMAVIMQRAMTKPAYHQVLDLASEWAVTRILAVCDGLSDVEKVAGLRVAGGTSKIIADALEDAIEQVPGTDEEVGSPMIPMRMSDVIRINYKLEINNKIRREVAQKS